MVNAIDSIRTKEMKLVTADKPLDAYGNDPIDIVNDWVTIAEDGYLTLRLRAAWGIPAKKHVFDLVGGVDNEDPFVVELRHDATGGSSTGQDDNTLMDSRRQTTLRTPSPTRSLLSVSHICLPNPRTTKN